MHLIFKHSLITPIIFGFPSTWTYRGQTVLEKKRYTKGGWPVLKHPKETRRNL